MEEIMQKTSGPASIIAAVLSVFTAMFISENLVEDAAFWVLVFGIVIFAFYMSILQGIVYLIIKIYTKWKK